MSDVGGLTSAIKSLTPIPSAGPSRLFTGSYGVGRDYEGH